MEISQGLNQSVIETVRELLKRALTEYEPVPWLDVCLRVMYREQRVIAQVLDTTMIRSEPMRDDG